MVCTRGGHRGGGVPLAPSPGCLRSPLTPGAVEQPEPQQCHFGELSKQRPPIDTSIFDDEHIDIAVGALSAVGHRAEYERTLNARDIAKGITDESGRV